MISKILLWVFAAFLLAMGGAMLVGGVWLVTLGGSFYYAVGGAVLVAVAALLVRGGAWGPRLYALFLAGTIVWSLIEAGLDSWALMPRLVAFIVIGLWMAAPWTRAALNKDEDESYLTAEGLPGIAAAAGALLVVVAAFQGYPSQPLAEGRPSVDLGAP
ncbi:MAG: hypothetical protein PVI23_12165, partial [Maricaulaceae bacterium]